MILHLYKFARIYCLCMIGTGILTSLVDHALYEFGAITRRVTLRGCFVIGLFWPLSILLLGHLLWKQHNRK